MPARNNPVVERPDKSAWAPYANCIGLGPELFFPEQGESTVAVKAVCAGCCVRFECLAYSVEATEQFGIWGGMGELTRKKLRRWMRLRPNATLEDALWAISPRWFDFIDVAEPAALLA